MPGMETKLHAVINQPGVYEGFGQLQRRGFSSMRFQFRGMSSGEFEQWVKQVRADGGALSRDAYLRLERPSEHEPVRRYASVDKGLYDAILNRCVAPGRACMRDVMAADARRRYETAMAPTGVRRRTRAAQAGLPRRDLHRCRHGPPRRRPHSSAVTGSLQR